MTLLTSDHQLRAQAPAGYVRSLRRWASTHTAPSVVAANLQGSGKPSATTSSFRPSLGIPMSKSRTNRSLSHERPLRDLSVLLHSPEQNLAFSRFLLWNKLHGGNEGRRVGGHTDCASENGARQDEGGEEGLSRVVARSESVCCTASCGAPPLLLAHSESAVRRNQEPLPADRRHQQLRSDKSCVPPTVPRSCRRLPGDAL